MRRHIEGQDLIFEVVVLDILVTIALAAVLKKQLVPLYFVHLYMRVKVL